jgi:hypothetical protein
MKKACCLLVCAAVLAAWGAQDADALPPFKKAFQTTYVDSGSEALKAAFKKGSCYTCHVKGEKKEVQNAYGKALNELIPGNAKERLKAAKENGTKDAEEAELLKELAAAFKTAEGLSATEGGPTYGERLKAGKLPVEPVEK